MRQSYVASLALAFVLTMPLVMACGKNAGDAIEDAAVTTRVKTAILNDPAVSGLRIDVDTSKGIVTLSGRVKSRTEREQAMALAQRVLGVAGVKDALEVIPDAPPASPSPGQTP
jgi:osmotically-inducible protein OsmY